MAKQKLKLTFNFICVEDRTVEISKNLVRNAINEVLRKHGAVSYNLEEVLDKYIVHPRDKVKKAIEFSDESNTPHAGYSNTKMDNAMWFI
ncbi:hypothetical protein D3C77_378360 [compost metagenome]